MEVLTQNEFFGTTLRSVKPIDSTILVTLKANTCVFFSHGHRSSVAPLTSEGNTPQLLKDSSIAVVLTDVLDVPAG